MSEKCTHCNGSGECYCDVCLAFAAQFNSGPARDEFDTQRIGEGTCNQCEGLGEITKNTDGKTEPVVI